MPGGRLTLAQLRSAEGAPLSVRVAGSAGVAGRLRIRMRGVRSPDADV